MHDLTYAQAIANAEHLKALGQTDVYLYRDNAEGFPFDKVTRVEEGSSFRLSGPSSCRLIAEEAGLRFSVSVDFENADANGRGVSLFDRDQLRDLMRKLNPAAREQFAVMLEKCVIPMAKRTAEIREALNSQCDSEDCVRGLIAFARGDAEGSAQ
jgi:hypothetical protein